MKEKVGTSNQQNSLFLCSTQTDSEMERKKESENSQTKLNKKK